MNGAWSLFSQLPEKNEVGRRHWATSGCIRRPASEEAEHALPPRRPHLDCQQGDRGSDGGRHFAILHTYLRWGELICKNNTETPVGTLHVVSFQLQFFFSFSFSQLKIVNRSEEKARKSKNDLLLWHIYITITTITSVSPCVWCPYASIFRNIPYLRNT